MQRDLIREYLLYLKAEKGLAKNSVEAYARDLKKLGAWSEKNGVAISELDERDLRNCK